MGVLGLTYRLYRNIKRDGGGGDMANCLMCADFKKGEGGNQKM